MTFGAYVYGVAAIAAGIINLVWGGFESGHQPIQAFGDNVPGREIFAYITAVWLIVAGAAILWRRSARAGAAALSIVYFIFAVFWLPRFVTAPRVLGFHISVYFGVMGGVGQQLILVAAGAIVWASLTPRSSLWPQRVALIARWTFGLCTIDFGLAHLTGVKDVATFVPGWMPLGGAFWTVVTGISFVLAGMAIVSGILDVLAARLLALMLAIFSGVVLAPMIFASPHDQTAWGGNAYNLAAVGAAWIVAEWLASRQKQHAAATG
jgi:uncharacterized membrane protein